MTTRSCLAKSTLRWKTTLWLALLALSSVFVGFFVANDFIWTDGLKPIVWDPIMEDAGSAGDAAYNPTNTLLYTFSMLASVVVLQALFRKATIPADDKMLLALLAWVCLAPVLRVLEDADFFSSEMDWLFISPIIHLHLAVWLVGLAFISHYVASQWDASSTDKIENKVRKALLRYSRSLCSSIGVFCINPHTLCMIQWVLRG